IIKIKSID
ncbi:hypothetical protein ACTFIU_008498, partial [Dictyostelium citrinum]